MSTTLSFEAAVARRDYALLQSAVRDMSKRDAVDHLHNLFPHLARQWVNRNLSYLMALDPERLASVLSHGDPTGEAAVRNVMREAS